MKTAAQGAPGQTRSDKVPQINSGPLNERLHCNFYIKLSITYKFDLNHTLRIFCYIKFSILYYFSRHKMTFRPLKAPQFWAAFSLQVGHFKIQGKNGSVIMHRQRPTIMSLN